MNLTELARILRVTPQELRDTLPQIGFDIGQKAIKVDNKTSQQILRNWRRLTNDLRKKQEAELEAKRREMIASGEIQKKKIKIPQYITVRDFSAISEIPVNKILKELMSNGVFASLNEKIDFDTVLIISDNLALDVELDESSGEKEVEDQGDKLKNILEKESTEKLLKRAPVIVVMGHVDHGKTRLLDAIRKTSIVEGEAGGITQHIGAYQVERKNRPLTFIDTPGHEAFTAMRSRGAKVADIAILVVAADDGVKLQTTEAFRIIKSAGVPFIVAINKIDKEGADVNRVKQELSSQLNITPEDWGGDTVCVEVSALKGQGVDDVLDMLLLTADMEEEKLKANPDAEAAGTVVESHVDKGAGPVATILIQNGTLKIGDQLCFGGVVYGKVRALKDYNGKDVLEAKPSVPVKILGLKIAPKVGDILEVGDGKKVKANRLKQNMKPEEMRSSEQEEKEDSRVKFNLILKSDVLGSLEAVEESLEKINTKKICAKIIYKGLGNITEGDIKKAQDSGAEVIGFNVKVAPQVENQIREMNIKVNNFEIIYDLIEYVKDSMKDLVEPEYERVDLGRLKVLAIFRNEPKAQIIGGKVLDGKIEKDSLIEVLKEKSLVAEGKLVQLQSGKQDVSIVETDEECGIKYEGKPVIEVGDILNFYKMKKIED